jgi:hypothetical protein
MQSRTIRTLALAAVTLGLGAFAYGRATEDPARALRTITITTRDFAFQAPDSLEEGPVTIHLVNEGSELHHVWLFRLGGGHTLDDAFAAFKSTGKLPEWVKEFGGPNAPHPRGLRVHLFGSSQAREAGDRGPEPWHPVARAGPGEAGSRQDGP